MTDIRPQAHPDPPKPGREPDLVGRHAALPTDADIEVPTGPRPVRSKPAGGSFLRELPFLILVAFALALVIKAFLVQAFYIPSGSMEETLLVKDRVLVNKLVYRFRDIHRGEIVVFNGLDSFTPEVTVEPPRNGLDRALRSVTTAIGVGQPGEKDFIKRVIAVPGDTVACCTNGHVTVKPPGGQPVELEEDYLYEDDKQSFRPVTVPEGRLWVMGDHRMFSADSRAHIDDENNGTVPADKVIGRAFVIVWPPGRAAVLGVPDTFQGTALMLPGQLAPAVPYALGLVVALPLTEVRRRVRRARVGSRGRAA